LSTARKLNILIIAGWYPNPAKSLHHGIFIQRHAQAISLLHQVTVVSFIASEIQKVETRKCSSALTEVCIFYRKPKTTFGGINAIITYRKLQRLFATEVEAIAKTTKADIVHQHIAYPLGIFSSQLCKKLGLPLVISEQWSGYLKEDNSFEKQPAKFFIRKAFTNAKAASAVSAVLAKAIERKGLMNNVSIIPNVIDPVFLSVEIRATHNTVPQMIHVSSLNDREKNISLLIQSLELVKKDGHEFHCSIIGDSDERVFFEQLVTSKYLTSNISFLGTKHPDELAELYSSSDFFLLTSNYETFGVVLVEALACGLPIVASNAGAIPELVDQSNGKLFTSGNVVEAKNAIVEMLHEHSLYNRVAIKQSAQNRFSSSVIAEEFSKLYNLLHHE
jgi:L-malate glycosyltransferase